MHRVVNSTPYAAAIAPAQDRDGGDLAVAVLKATLRFDARGAVSPAPPDAQLPVHRADVHHGDPATTSLRWASDVSPAKAGTDVALAGHAYGRGRREVEAGLRIGAVEKLVVASGPRVWVAGFPVTVAGPVAFERTPLRWEHAFGGGYEEEGRGRVAWPDNPVGVGFARAVVDRAPLPSIELRGARYRALKDRPAPAGLGFVPAGWRQRARFAGTFDAAWERTRRPLLPEDLDERFWNTVPQDQVLRPKLQGGERLELLNVHPEAERVALGIPRLAFTAAFRVRDGETVLPMTADTLLVEPDEGRLAITYRAVLPVGDDLRRLQAVFFRAAREPAAAAPRAAPRAR
ncbi:MAG TPA: DUF2169 domain-containing protein [Anaeromyxobacter sp.]|nr:DUF2169 domain-containing protein [Anaeromyxobacter sp.]